MKNLIDAHVHVWTDDLDSYPLSEEHTKAHMRPPVFLPEDILHHAQPSGVERVVLIQMSYYGFDNSYMCDVIAARPETFRGVAVIDHTGTAQDRVMRELKEQGVRGFRLYPRNDSPDTWLDQDGYATMFRGGAEEGLAMCPLIDPNALASVGRMCERFPDTTVVVDHLARIGVTGEIRQAEVDALCRLSAHPNAHVKVSAFYALGEKKPPHLDLIPMIRKVWNAFGAGRLIWASDCPFQTVNETYEDGLSLVRDRLDFLSAEEREWLLHRTAEQVFFA